MIVNNNDRGIRRRPIDAASRHNELRSLLDTRRQALLAGDADALAHIVHLDFRYVDSLGRDLDRAAYLASRRTGEIAFTRQDFSDIVIRDLTPGRGAMITCRVHDAGRFRGVPFESQTCTVHICIRDDGPWLFLFGQSTTTEASADR